LNDHPPLTDEATLEPPDSPLQPEALQPPDAPRRPDSPPPDAALAPDSPLQQEALQSSAGARRPGSAVFSIEGRAAPGLYLVGWLASVLGFAVFLAVVLAAPGGAGAAILLITAAVLLAVGLVSAAGAQGMERRARGATYAGPSPFLVFAASLPVALPVAIIALRLVELAGVDPLSPLASLIGQLILVLGLVALVRLLVVGVGALSWSEMGIRWPGLSAALGHLASGAVYAVPVVLVTAVVSGVLVTLLGTQPEPTLPSTREPAGIAINFFAAVVIAPVGEEIFFRGFSLTAWDRSIGGRGALIRSALFFAFIHVLTVGGVTFSEAGAKAIIGFTARIPVALALGWIFLRRRSILAPIGLHSGYNAVLLLIAEMAAR